VDLDGETLDGFYTELDSCLSESPEEVQLDCSLLEHATSTHINTLWQARNRCEENGIPVRLTSVTYGLQRVLDVLDLYDLFIAERDGIEAKTETGRPRGETDQPMLALRIPPTEEGIRAAMQELHDYLTELKYGEIFAFDLETVFYEVTTNIRLHGELSEGDSIQFTAVPMNGAFHLHFEDRGPHFDPTKRNAEFNPEQAISRRQRHGFGLAMIKRLVDSISYEREDTTNILKLEKNIRWNGGQS
jgi:anti-sigma regulatory factor (Ser/Thr protein kinase)/anti-anti-sigma regulatory factor